MTNANIKQQYRILNITEDHSAISGGVATVVDQMVRRMRPFCDAIDIVCVRENPILAPSGVNLGKISPVWYGNAWGWSKALVNKLDEITSSVDKQIIHIHGIWAAPQWLGAKIAYDKGIPFIVTSHGMLEPWLWDKQGWKIKLKKRLYWKLMVYPVFHRANVIHAITPLERDHLRLLFPHQRIEVIPNVIDLVAIDSELGQIAFGPEPIILFLGRIEPKKGIDILLHAFVKAKLPLKWRVMIAGPTWSEDYQTALKKIIRQHGIESRVDFIGPIYGETKWTWLKRAWIVSVPSYSEVVGIVNLEAAACGTPTITTFETGLFDWGGSGGFLIHPDVDELSVALQKASSWTASERMDRGLQSRSFIETRYSWEVILSKWIDLYQSVLK